MWYWVSFLSLVVINLLAGRNLFLNHKARYTILMTFGSASVFGFFTILIWWGGQPPPFYFLLPTGLSLLIPFFVYLAIVENRKYSPASRKRVEESKTVGNQTKRQVTVEERSFWDNPRYSHVHGKIALAIVAIVVVAIVSIYNFVVSLF